MSSSSWKNWRPSRCSPKRGSRLRRRRGVRSPADVFLITRILVFAGSVPVLVRLGPARMTALLEPRRQRSARGADVDKIATYVDAVIHAARPIVRPGCLTRGITLYFFLRREGIDVTLHFGMSEVDGEFVGHCWLTRDEAPFLESCRPGPTFHTVWTIPRPGPGLPSP